MILMVSLNIKNEKGSVIDLREAIIVLVRGLSEGLHVFKLFGYVWSIWVKMLAALEKFR